MPLWQETVLLLAGALVLAIVIKALFVQAFYIPSESMEPGLVKNDRILVEKPSYWLGGEPQRGDVVVFKDPGGWLGPEDVSEATNPVTRLLTKVGLYPSGGHLVKRVIGTPGDVVECCDDQGRLMVNGKPIDESAYARPNDVGCAPGTAGKCFGPMPGVKHWKTPPVPKGMLFVMGDNRAHSADSSYHLCTANETDCTDSPWVSAGLVVGKVMAVVWPAGKVRFEHRPDSFDPVPAP
ncbi:signal peptidase I [Nocardioides terrae]|uniref:Signal peptidase I n=2 Tax=Nocardioides terrae TaxID=574651 RepID=A0A1I1J6K2_9ACTN|nr:signal peptidase I [Nocardioides terrae]